jgi:SAM-dependent methyltransferase
MIRYCATAMALKAFSASRPTKNLYRVLGNSVGGRTRASGKIPEYYINRVLRTLDLSERFGFVKDGDRLLELGTGWFHWDALTTRLFFDVHGVLYDVWDNRQMNGLKNYLRQLDDRLGTLKVDPRRRNRARRLISEIERTTDYRSLYELLDFEYVVDSAGTLAGLEGGTFDVVISAGVLEHVYIEDTTELIYGIARILKPGGWCAHSINIRDHLYQYDVSVSPKQYLRYSHRVWKSFFENDVQYINKLQRSDWLRVFTDAGLLLVDENVEYTDLCGMRVARDYRNYAVADLACTDLNIVHRKPQ